MAKTWDEIKAIFVADIARHRANGCRVYDSPWARCTCPDPTDISSWENEGGFYPHEKD